MVSKCSKTSNTHNFWKQLKGYIYIYDFLLCSLLNAPLSMFRIHAVLCSITDVLKDLDLSHVLMMLLALWTM